MPEERSTPPPPPPRTASLPPYPPHAAPPPSGRPPWFWILIIGCAFIALVPIVLIVLAISIPSLLKVKKNANQASAIQTIRIIGSAEISYNSMYPNPGFACPLSALGGDPNSGSATPQSARLVDPALAETGHKSGYVFTVTCGGKVHINDRDVYTSYQVTAVPETIGKTGDVGYCSNENMEIRVDPTGSSNCTQPLQ